MNNTKSERLLGNTPRMLLGMLLMAGLTACQQFNSDPVRVMSSYGKSDREMVANAILNPEKARNPAPALPEGMQGQKGFNTYQRTWQTDVGSPQRFRQQTQIGASDGGSSVGSGGGGR